MTQHLHFWAFTAEEWKPMSTQKSVPKYSQQLFITTTNGNKADRVHGSGHTSCGISDRTERKDSGVPILKGHVQDDVWKLLLSMSRSQNNRCADSVHSRWGTGMTLMVQQEGAYSVRSLGGGRHAQESLAWPVKRQAHPFHPTVISWVWSCSLEKSDAISGVNLTSLLFLVALLREFTN